MMPSMSKPRLDPADPRCQRDAYISLEKHLYEVIELELTGGWSGMLSVRNCAGPPDGPSMRLTAREVESSVLELAAPPPVTLPDGWGTLPQPVAQVESD